MLSSRSHTPNITGYTVPLQKKSEELLDKIKIKYEMEKLQTLHLHI